MMEVEVPPGMDEATAGKIRTYQSQIKILLYNYQVSTIMMDFFIMSNFI